MIESVFVQALVEKVRAVDTYGVWKKLSDERVLAPYIKSNDDKKAISTAGAVKGETIGYLRIFYETIAFVVERQTGHICNIAVDINHEGFGKALVYAEDAILVNDPLRDVHKFGFPTLEKLAARGDRLLEKALKKAAELPAES